eukprot:5218639-Pleurochrysis_carterae.AAC.1
MHRLKVKEGEVQLERLSTAIDSLMRKAVKVSAEDPGQFALAFFDTMDKFDFQRQAYHSGALPFCLLHMHKHAQAAAHT